MVRYVSIDTDLYDYRTLSIIVVILASSAGIHRYVNGKWSLVLSWSKLGTRYGKDHVLYLPFQVNFDLQQSVSFSSGHVSFTA